MVFVRFCIIALLLHGSVLFAGDWARFRGPNGTGISTDSQPTPTKWSAAENLTWKTELPGPGVSSPIVVGDRVFVTCYSGYGIDRNNPGEMENLKRHLLCIDAGSGEKRWEKVIEAVLPEDPFSGIGIPNHGYASHSPVSDGKHVFVFFGKTGAFAFDMDGKQLWQTSVGTESDPRRWGSSSSPIVYKNLLIVTASAESQALVALDKTTGKEVWRQEAAGFDGVWGTPALVEVNKDRTDLVVSVPNEVWAFDPDTGKLRWYCESMASDQANTSALIHQDLVIAVAGRGGGSIAIRTGGDGDVTESHVAWTGRESVRFGTPVALEDRIYVVASDIVTCVEAKTGKRLYQSRLQGGSPPPESPAQDRGGRSGFGGRGGRSGGRGGSGGMGGSDYASPVIADGKLYYLKSSGETYVFQIGDQLESLAVNRVTDDRESFAGTPAISNGRLFLRSNKHLYCVAE